MLFLYALGSETHFKVVVVSKKFENLPLIKVIFLFNKNLVFNQGFD